MAGSLQPHWHSTWRRRSQPQYPRLFGAPAARRPPQQTMAVASAPTAPRVHRLKPRQACRPRTCTPTPHLQLSLARAAIRTSATLTTGEGDARYFMGDSLLQMRIFGLVLVSHSHCNWHRLAAMATSATAGTATATIATASRTRTSATVGRVDATSTAKAVRRAARRANIRHATRATIRAATRATIRATTRAGTRAMANASE